MGELRPQSNRRLTNKQLIVLELLREGDEWSAQRVADTVTSRTACSACGGACQVDGEKCEQCYGRGRRYFSYTTAYQALERLRKVGLVERRNALDLWGDPLPNVVYSAAPAPDPTDPLEALYQVPAAGGDDA